MKHSFVLALLISVLIHAGVLWFGSFQPAPQKKTVNELNVTMQTFDLDKAPETQETAENTPESVAEEQPTPEPAPTPAPSFRQPENIVLPPAMAEQSTEEKQPEKQENIADTDNRQPEKQASDVQDNDRQPEKQENMADKNNRQPEKTELNQPTQNPLAKNLAEENPVENTPKSKVVTQNAYDIIAPKSKQSPAFPKDAALKYEGPYSITGNMNFHRDEKNYVIEASFNIPFNKMKFRSEGEIVGNQLIPHRYTHHRKGKLYASAEFDYENKELRFGKGETQDKTQALEHPAYDFFSWAWQISINGGYVYSDLLLTNGKKVYLQKTPAPDEILMEEILYDTGEGKLRMITQKIERQKEETQDTVNYGFAPDFANVPALITFHADGKEYSMHVIAIQLDHFDYWKAQRRVGGLEPKKW